MAVQDSDYTSRMENNICLVLLRAGVGEVDTVLRPFRSGRTKAERSTPLRCQYEDF